MRPVTGAILALVAALPAACTPVAPGAAGPGGAPFHATFRDGGTFPSAPARLAVATDGTVWVSDPRGGRVVALSGGVPVLEVSGFEEPLGVAVRDGLLLVGDARRGSVNAYDIDTRKPLFALGRGAGEFELPNSIAVAPDGAAIYVADSRAHEIKAYDAAGRPGVRIGGRGTEPGRFVFPAAVAATADRIVVADQGNHRVQVLGRDGSFRFAFGAELPQRILSADEFRGAFTRVQGIALAGDRTYVLDSYQGHVQVFDAAGTAAGFVGARGDCEACLDLPLDVGVDAAGNVLVADAGARRVVTLSPEPRSRP